MLLPSQKILEMEKLSSCVHFSFLQKPASAAGKPPLQKPQFSPPYGTFSCATHIKRVSVCPTVEFLKPVFVIVIIFKQLLWTNTFVCIMFVSGGVNIEKLFYHCDLCSSNNHSMFASYCLNTTSTWLKMYHD